MSMLTLTARLRACGMDTPDTPVLPTEVSGVTLPLLACTPDTFDTPKKSGGLPLGGVVNPAVPSADAAPVGYNFSAPVPHDVDPDAFYVRVALFSSHDIPAKEAGNLAGRLGRRDVKTDDRRLCLECCHLSGAEDARRCANWRVTGMRGPAIPGELVDLLQRCAGFGGQAEPAPTSLPIPAVALVVTPREDEGDGDE